MKLSDQDLSDPRNISDQFPNVKLDFIENDKIEEEEDEDILNSGERAS